MFNLKFKITWNLQNPLYYKEEYNCYIVTNLKSYVCIFESGNLIKKYLSLTEHDLE